MEPRTATGRHPGFTFFASPALAGGTQRIAGAEDVKVKVEVADKRAVKDHIGRKGYEYSFLGPIIAENDVRETVVKAMGEIFADVAFIEALLKAQEL